MGKLVAVALMLGALVGCGQSSAPVVNEKTPEKVEQQVEDEAKVSRAGAEIKQLSDFVAVYRLNNGALPQSLENLKALKGFAVASVDPWSRPYSYRVVSEAEGEFEVRSSGADLTKATDDVYWETKAGKVMFPN